MSNPEPSPDTPARSPPSDSDPDSDSNRPELNTPIDAIRSHAEDHLIAMFGDPPTAPCTSNDAHTLREGDRVSLAVAYSEENGVAETHAIHCRTCELPDAEDIPYGDWVGFLTGIAKPNTWIDGGGDCLLFREITVHSIHRIPETD